MKVLHSFTHALLIAAMACTLTACGGGDDNQPDPQPQPTPSPVPSKYDGAWADTDGCDEGELMLASTGRKLYETYTLELADNCGSANRCNDLQVRVITRLYEDARCIAQVGVREEIASLSYLGETVRNLGTRQVTTDRYNFHWVSGELRNLQTGESAPMGDGYRTDLDQTVAGFRIYARDVYWYLFPSSDQATMLYTEGNRLYIFDDYDDDPGEFIRR